MPPPLDLSIVKVLGEPRRVPGPELPPNVVYRPPVYYGPLAQDGSQSRLLLRTPPRIHPSLHADVVRATPPPTPSTPTVLPDALPYALGMVPRSVVLASSASRGPASDPTAPRSPPTKAHPLDMAQTGRRSLDFTADPSGSGGDMVPLDTASLELGSAGGVSSLSIFSHDGIGGSDGGVSSQSTFSLDGIAGSSNANGFSGLKKFTIEDLITATAPVRGFDSTVTTGTIKNHGKVLIKSYDRLDPVQMQDANLRIEAMDHPHQLKIVGVCPSSKELMLVFEFDFLCSLTEKMTSECPDISLGNCLKIVTDMVDGLKYVTRLSSLTTDCVYLKEDYSATVLDFPSEAKGKGMVTDLGSMILLLLPDYNVMPGTAVLGNKSRRLRFIAGCCYSDAAVVRLSLHLALDIAAALLA